MLRVYGRFPRFRISVQNAAPHELVLTVACSMALGLAGAWFGGSLFPPLAKVPPRKRLGPEAV